MTTLTLPYPPTLNHLYKNVRRGGRVKTPEYKQWRDAAVAVVRAQRPAKVNGSYRLTILLDRPDLRARDIDNTTKALSDALKLAEVIDDDSKAQSILIAWAWDSVVKGGDVTLSIEPAVAPIFVLGRAA